MVVKTEIMQSLVSKVSKVSMYSRHLAISGLISIKAGNGLLTLHSTDIDNHLIISANVMGVEDFEAVVNKELFCKLVAKLDSPDFTMIVNENNLEVKSGKSVYKLEIPLDENGSPVALEVLPEPEEYYSVNSNYFDTIMGYLEASVASEATMPIYTNYCFTKNAAISTNQIKMCYIKGSMFGEAEYLIPPRFFQLFNLLNSAECTYGVTENGIFMKSPGVLIIGLPAANPMEEYNADAIENLVNQEFTGGTFKINKIELLKILDRLSLFVKDEDRMAVTMSTNSSELCMSSISKSGVDNLKIEWLSEPNINFVAKVDVMYLCNLLEHIPDDFVTISINENHSIKIMSEKAMNLLAFLED